MPAGTDELSVIVNARCAESAVQPPQLEYSDGMRLDKSASILPRSVAAERRRLKTRTKREEQSIVAAAVPAFAQVGSERGKEVRIVGCVQWEKDYRRERHEGAGGESN